MLREKSNLPKYGTCWTGAIDHVEDGCRNLSEDSQSDMALHLTNCFLEMSGHDTYNCELNKKPNLRSICINDMSDRAFNVYTEFYTHVQNICWFLRGQIWYETITDNSFKVGKQLEESANNQKELIATQQQSVELQKKILMHETMLEEVLSDLYISTKAHQEIIQMMTRSLATFQTWVIGEVSWVDSIIFYFFIGISIYVFTSMKRSSNARLGLLALLFLNFLFERIICQTLLYEDSLSNSKLLYQDIYSYIWYSRYFFIILMISYFVYYCYKYKDIHRENNQYLQIIVNQNSKIFDLLQFWIRNNPAGNENFDVINEHSMFDLLKNTDNINHDESSSSTHSEIIKSKIRKNYITRTHSPLISISPNRYYLRNSKQNTPGLT